MDSPRGLCIDMHGVRQPPPRAAVFRRARRLLPTLARRLGDRSGLFVPGKLFKACVTIARPGFSNEFSSRAIPFPGLPAMES